MRCAELITSMLIDSDKIEEKTKILLLFDNGTDIAIHH